MKKISNLLLFILLAVIPNQLFAQQAAPNMAPIISYLLSDSTPTNSTFTKGTPSYYITETGIKGNRTLSASDNTYTGTYDDLSTTQTGIADNGTYTISNNTLTLSKDNGDTIVITYLAPAEYGNGKAFSVSVNNGTPFEAYGYDSDAARTDALTQASAFMHDFFVGSQKYYLDGNAHIGQRYVSNDEGTLPYTGSYNGLLDGTYDSGTGTSVSGRYFILADTMVLTRTDPSAATVVITHTGTDANLSVNDFNVSVDGAAPVPATYYKFQTARDRDYFPSDLGYITVDEFAGLVQLNNTDFLGSWWYIDNASQFENIVINNDGTLSMTEYVNNTAQGSETLYYTSENNATFGDYIGIHETSGGPILEAVKFYQKLTSADLRTLYPHITFRDGAAAIKDAGMSIVESFEPWSDSNTVDYTNFSDLIVGMTYGNDNHDWNNQNITGSSSGDSLVFATGSSGSSGSVVRRSNGADAGTYEIRDVDGTSTLVVTITDPDFMEWGDTLAFQYMDPNGGTNNAMYRGDIANNWSDIELNDIAKEDVVNFLNTH